MQDTTPPAQSSFDRQKLRDVVQYARLRTTTAQQLDRPIEVLTEQAHCHAAERHRDDAAIAFIGRAVRWLKAERRRRWDSERSKREVEQLERDHGAALDGLADSERDELLVAVATAKGWDLTIARRVPAITRTAILRYMAERKTAP